MPLAIADKAIKAELVLKCGTTSTVVEVAGGVRDDPGEHDRRERQHDGRGPEGDLRSWATIRRRAGLNIALVDP